MTSRIRSGSRPVSNAPFPQEAVSILAPGQSGDFTTAEFTQDQAQGALIGSDPSVYGDHVDDQRLPYWNSEFKDGRFLDDITTVELIS